ncbi:MAG TPA: endo-1,3-alpha-glucanase family glycosylhydrolase, partial [Chthonomonadales bacterium]|nr:endo-1,3-alpha-glucanase family glycosylhydrolase [Chthonomonadales bacterium]
MKQGSRAPADFGATLVRMLLVRIVPITVAAWMPFAYSSCAAASNPSTVKEAAVQASGPHYVFAHYMVTLFAYGADVASYEKEIRLAQAAGIDGFALNCAAWRLEPRYKARARMIYDAADRVGNFKLFFSADMVGRLTADDVRDMVTTFGRRKSQFTQNGRIVLSTFLADRYGPEFWQNQVLQPLAAQGYPVFFVPH